MLLDFLMLWDRFRDSGAIKAKKDIKRIPKSVMKDG